MTSAPDQSFDGAAVILNDYAKTLRGYVRYVVAQRNLEPFLTKKPMHVLDIGGGSGIDAAWLAHKGHRVTLLEASKAQRDAAQSRFNFLLQEADRKRITIIPGSYDDLPPEAANYDLVLLHGVAMYQREPAKFITKAATYLREGGTLSLLEKGYYGAQSRAIRRGNNGQLDSIRDSHVYINSMKLEAHAFKPEELEEILRNAKLSTIEWSGVRVITDEMFEYVADIDGNLLKDIMEAEYQQGRHSAIRGQGQMLHFIAQKR
jgi:S-adenosylmethionine-dependent methyltransferase